MWNKAIRQVNSARAGIESLEKCFKVGMLERKNEGHEFLTSRGEFGD